MIYISINAKLEKLEEFKGYLRDYQKHTLEEIRSNHTLYGALLHFLQLTIECMMDIGEIIISESKLRKPQEGKEIFMILAENKILPLDCANKVASLPNLCNLIVHEYAEVDLKKVYAHLQNDLGDCDFYAKCITEFLEKRNFLGESGAH